MIPQGSLVETEAGRLDSVQNGVALDGDRAAFTNAFDHIDATSTGPPNRKSRDGSTGPMATWFQPIFDATLQPSSLSVSA